MWGLGAGSIGGLGLDAVSFLVTGEGDGVRIALSAGLCVASGTTLLVGLVADRLLRRKHERGGDAG